MPHHRHDSPLHSPRSKTLCCCCWTPSPFSAGPGPVRSELCRTRKQPAVPRTTTSPTCKVANTDGEKQRHRDSYPRSMQPNFKPPHTRTARGSCAPILESCPVRRGATCRQPENACLEGWLHQRGGRVQENAFSQSKLHVQHGRVHQSLLIPETGRLAPLFSL